MRPKPITPAESVTEVLDVSEKDDKTGMPVNLAGETEDELNNGGLHHMSMQAEMPLTYQDGMKEEVYFSDHQQNVKEEKKSEVTFEEEPKVNVT